MTPGGYPQRACVRCGTPTAGVWCEERQRAAVCSTCLPREPRQLASVLARRIDAEHRRRAPVLATREGRR